MSTGRSANPPRALVTGMGVVSSCGLDVEAFWDSLVRGRSGISKLECIDTTDLRSTIGGEVKEFRPGDFVESHEAKRMDRFAQFAVAAARMALHDADLTITSNGAFRTGIVLGTGIGGIQTIVEQIRTMNDRGPRRVSPYTIPMMIGNMAAGQISMLTGARGPCTTVVTACASGADAVGDAMRLIQWGEADVVLAGGTEAPFTRVSIAGFGAAHTLSTRNDEPARASRPFDAQRDGFVMSEGAAVLILESEEHALRRGARAYGAVAGRSQTADAAHITAPAPDGLGRLEGMRMAIADAGLTLADVGYINAHGTSTPANDKDESQVIKRLWEGNPPPVSSTKSVTGHMLGAAGAIEAVACILAINRGTLPPTINYEYPDPECDLDYVPNVARAAMIRAAISNSFGFGGQNSVLAFTDIPEEMRRTAPARRWPGLGA
ncbi:MAG: beta-ketoacyl-ACP synthase II [Bacillota bacterium]|nr:beta-ketoacyl-ACP synthase II [Bacillota bacterium]